MSAEIATSDAMREVARLYSIGCTQVVTDGPEGNVVYHLVVGDGEARFGAGPAEPEDIRLYGDQQKLIDSQPVFGALDAAFQTVRENTRYE